MKQKDGKKKKFVLIIAAGIAVILLVSLLVRSDVSVTDVNEPVTEPITADISEPITVDVSQSITDTTEITAQINSPLTDTEPDAPEIIPMKRVEQEATISSMRPEHEIIDINDTTGVYTISVNEDGGVVIIKYEGEETEVIIPTQVDGEHITAIGEGAFKDNEFLTYLYVQDNIEQIADGAFAGCNKLINVTISNIDTEIAPGVFEDCPNLAYITLSDAFIPVLYLDNLELLDIPLMDVLSRLSGSWVDKAYYDGADISDNIIFPFYFDIPQPLWFDKPTYIINRFDDPIYHPIELITYPELAEMRMISEYALKLRVYTDSAIELMYNEQSPYPAHRITADNTKGRINEIKYYDGEKEYTMVRYDYLRDPGRYFVKALDEGIELTWLLKANAVIADAENGCSLRIYRSQTKEDKGELIEEYQLMNNYINKMSPQAEHLYKLTDSAALHTYVYYYSLYLFKPAPELLPEDIDSDENPIEDEEIPILIGGKPLMKVDISALDTKEETPIEASEEQKILRLTFDDGPSKTNTPPVLDILKEKNIKGTFFVVGVNAARNTELLRRIVREGHAIGLHSYTHDYPIIYKSTGAFLKEHLKTQRIVYEATGVITEIYRYPGGSTNSYAKTTFEAIANEMNNRGFIYFDWNMVVQDSRRGVIKGELLRAVKNGSKPKNGVLLSHDSNTYIGAELLSIIDYLLIENEYITDVITLDTPVCQFK